jgi:hypothetical protein
VAATVTGITVNMVQISGSGGGEQTAQILGSGGR